jgi:hypothetical protein
MNLRRGLRKRLLACALVAPGAAAAHGFGQRYDLPLPLELYATGAALTVVISCVMFAFYARAPRAEGYSRWDLLGTTPGRLLASAPAIAVLRFASAAIFALLLFAGFFGNQATFRNVVPITVWALGWVGLAYFSALVGDIWKVANPLETIFAALERWHARVTGGRALSLGIGAPARLAAWPGVFLYIVFLWLEMAWHGADSPRSIASVMAAYALVTWLGMWVFGREAWLERGEFFSLVFGLLARFAPLHVELEGRRVSRWHLRPYAVGLFEKEPLDVSRTALVLLILAAVTFDGFMETPVWASIAQAYGGEDSHGLRTAGLVLAPFVFALLYLSSCRLIAFAGGVASPGERGRIPGLFVLTLVPIAIAYLVAHYLTFLVQASQYLVPLASDPLGRGWNLFSTANDFVRISVLAPRFVWITCVAAIVAGHVAALYLAHSVSMREFPTRSAAMRSQWPMLVLMVAYTMSSLWIVAQPIVTTR